MLRGLHNKAPELDALAIISTGVPRLRDTIPEHLLDVVLGVYCEAINRVLLIPAIALVGATIGVLFMAPRRFVSPFAQSPSPVG